ncbi:MAG: hypothetical protein BJ554DRAFT_8414, partial [Olpidium bornovanus]
WPVRWFVAKAVVSWLDKLACSAAASSLLTKLVRAAAPPEPNKLGTAPNVALASRRFRVSLSSSSSISVFACSGAPGGTSLDVFFVNWLGGVVMFGVATALCVTVVLLWLWRPLLRLPAL